MKAHSAMQGADPATSGPSVADRAGQFGGRRRGDSVKWLDRNVGSDWGAVQKAAKPSALSCEDLGAPVSVPAATPSTDSRVGRGRCASDLSYLETHTSAYQSPSVGSGATPPGRVRMASNLGDITEKEIVGEGEDDENVDEIDAESSDDDTFEQVSSNPATPAGKRLSHAGIGNSFLSSAGGANGNGNGNGICTTHQRTAPTPDSEGRRRGLSTIGPSLNGHRRPSFLQRMGALIPSPGSRRSSMDKEEEEEEEEELFFLNQ